MFEFEHIVLDLFSPFPTRSSPCKLPQVRLTAAARTSIVNLPTQEPCCLFFRKAVSFEHSISSPNQLLLREGKKTILTNDRQMTRQKVSPQFRRRSVLSPPRSRSRPVAALQHRDFLSNSKYWYRTLTQPDVADILMAGHARRERKAFSHKARNKVVGRAST